ncbi:hypothetical protein CPB86DRAFT_787105 [Serendipita vermifera]|nr:hypothetical protein CPB86DRAFT_787105 [Serendipita vermifera]
MLLVHFVGKPGEEPKRIGERLKPSPFGVLVYLQSGFQWEYVRPTDAIQDTEDLEIDVVDLRDINRYVIALLHEEENKESPLILNIGRSGATCCSSKCGTLEAHLKNRWPDYIVTRAVQISDRSVDILYRALNETAFINQTHDLYLRWEPKQQIQQCSP